MPIKSLESYFFQRKQVFQAPIEILANATIGIDLEYYLSRIYTPKKEQYLVAIGGVPSSLKDYLQSDLQILKEYNIKPIFVVSGLKIESQLTEYKQNELSRYEEHLAGTWTKVANSQKLGPQQQHSFHSESFRTAQEGISLEPIINDIIKCFIELGIEYMICPYDASFQLSYLLQNKLIDTIYGSTDLMLTEIDKFILAMEFQSKEFKFVDKRKVLQEFGLNDRQFTDLSLMVGCALQPNTFPIFPPQPRPTNPQQPFPALNYFKLGLDMVYQYIQFSGVTSDFYGYILNFNDPKLIDWYTRGLSAIKYVPVITTEGSVELYNVEMAKLKLNKNVDYLTDEEDDPEKPYLETEENKRIVRIPSNLHEVISQRIPPELFFYQSLGLLPVDLLSSIARGIYDIRPPAAVGRSDSYKSLVSSPFFIETLEYQYNLITQLLARYYQVKKVVVKFWFNKEVEINNRISPSIAKRVGDIFVKTSESTNGVFNLQQFLASGLTNGKEEVEGEITSSRDIVSTALLRAFSLYGIIDKKRDLSSVGTILQQLAANNAINQAEKVEDDLEQVVTILLLLKASSSQFEPDKEYASVSKAFSAVHGPNGVAPNLNEEEARKVLLIAKVFSFKKIAAAPLNYQGPVSRSLLSFRSHTELVRSSLSHTIECVLVDLMVRQEKNNIKGQYQTKQDWFKLVDQLPFYKTEPNTLLGVISEIFFEVALKQQKLGASNKDAAHFAKDYLAEHVYRAGQPTHNMNAHGQNAFSKEQLERDLAEGARWWKVFVSVIKAANEKDKSLCSDAFLKEVIDADSLIDQVWV
ncbi:uncharacterized protein LODBEIA_P51080 [Lodderomyces beijingensis]|uniref:XPG-I domain-containing protein n=1 Tax=Lodderomyces beijingensis TaxID=1775926 RepID=A0ABP0ZRZ2_9ASCO